MATKFAALAAGVLAGFTISTAQAAEPKHGGILQIYHRETPPSLSIHEEATFSVNVPAMGIFNNLVIYDQHKPQTSMDTIVPELATSWAWDKANTALTFKLRQGVKWHDGVPFTAKDVKCTFDLLQGKAQDKFRKNPRKDWYAQRDRRHRQRRLSRRPSISSGRSPRCWRCSPPAIRRSIPATCPRRRCARIRSAPARSNSSRMKQNEFDQAREESGLLEKGPALSRRHRIHHHQEPRDRGARLRRRQGRHDVPDRDDVGARSRHQEAGPDRDLRTQADQRQHQSHHQSRRAAVQQSRTAQGDGAVARPQGVHRHHPAGARRPGRRACCRRRKASGACRRIFSRPFPAMAT